MPMPIRVQCPLCKSRFELAEFAPHRKVRCPECLELVHAGPVEVSEQAESPADAYAVQETAVRREDDKPPRPSTRRRQDEEEERSRPRRRRSANEAEAGRSGKPSRRMPPQFAMVHLGLLFYSARVVSSLLGFLAEVMGPMLIPVLGLSEGLLLVSWTFDNIIGVVISLLGVTGAVLCCRVPSQSKARPLIFAALAGDALSVALRFLAGFVVMLVALKVGGNATAAAFQLCTVLAWLCSVGALLMFLLFVRGLARYLGEIVPAKEAIAILMQMGSLVFVRLDHHQPVGPFQGQGGRWLPDVCCFGILPPAWHPCLRDPPPDPHLHPDPLHAGRVEARSAGGRGPSLSELPVWAFLPVPVAAFLLLSCLIPPARASHSGRQRGSRPKHEPGERAGGPRGSAREGAGRAATSECPTARHRLPRADCLLAVRGRGPRPSNRGPIGTGQRRQSPRGDPRGRHSRQGPGPVQQVLRRLRVSAGAQFRR